MAAAGLPAANGQGGEAPTRNVPFQERPLEEILRRIRRRAHLRVRRFLSKLAPADRPPNARDLLVSKIRLTGGVAYPSERNGSRSGAGPRGEVISRAGDADARSEGRKVKAV